MRKGRALAFAMAISAMLTVCSLYAQGGTALPGEAEGITKVDISIGGAIFAAVLYDSESAAAFARRLPLTLSMSELNGNEKYAYLPERLPAAGERVGNISCGELMLYGSDCLVLFYQGFPTSYSYTRLGRITDTAGLAAALGSGSVRVSFSVAR